jgi:hypothetical protein
MIANELATVSFTHSVYDQSRSVYCRSAPRHVIDALEAQEIKKTGIGSFPARSQGASALNGPNICKIYEIDESLRSLHRYGILNGMTLKAEQIVVDSWKQHGSESGFNQVLSRE